MRRKCEGLAVFQPLVVYAMPSIQYLVGDLYVIRVKDGLKGEMGKRS